MGGRRKTSQSQFVINPPRRSAIVERLDNLFRGVEPQIWKGAVHTPNTDRSLNTTRDLLNIAGTIVSLNVEIVSGTPRVGQVYVRVVLEDSHNREVHTLCRGYIYPGHEIFGSGALSFQKGDNIRVETRGSLSCSVRPVARILQNRSIAGGWTGVDKGSLEGPGNLRDVTGTDPAANANLTEAVPTNARWRIRGIRVQLVTSGTTATRRMSLRTRVTAGGNIFYAMYHGITQTATLTYDYSYIPGYPSDGIARVATEPHAFLPDDLQLLQGYVIQSDIQSLSTGDNLGAPILEVEEWIEE